MILLSKQGKEHGERIILKPYYWIILGVVFLGSIAATMNQFKVPPVMPVLISEFSLSMTQGGLLMSVFSFAGLVIAFPAGIALAKLGPRCTFSLALLAITAGSVWGTYSGSDLALVFSRTLEGAGMATIGVCAPVIITSWFPLPKRGLALGIWSAWVSAGVILMMNLSPLVTPPGQWLQTWWLGTVVALASVAVFNLFYRPPPTLKKKTKDIVCSSLTGLLAETLSHRNVWVLSMVLFCFNIMVLAMNTFLPTYLGKLHGFTMQEADFYASIANLVMLVSCPLGGWLVDKTGYRRTIISLCLIGFAVWWLVIFRVDPGYLPWLMALFGLLAGPVITTVISTLPDAVGRPILLGMGMSLLMFWHHLGEFAGPIYFGKVIDMTGAWSTAGSAMVPICLLGAILVLMLKINHINE